MKLRVVRESPPPALARQLELFEQGFSYPLGPGRSFHISHAPDYTLFYRSMGPAACFIAEQNDEIAGTLCVAIRDLKLPDGAMRQAAYVGDLKIGPDSRSSRALLHLSRAADEWTRPQVTAAFGVVMDGTGATPETYSGRVGIESFAPLEKIMVLRLATARDIPEPMQAITTGDAQCFASLAAGCCVAFGGAPEERSEIPPRWLVASDGRACGRLEDTRRAKRLIGDDRVEMVSAHLACFAFATPDAGAALIHAARHQAALLGFPVLFVAVPPADFSALDHALGPLDKVIAPAVIYGAGLGPGASWIINTSEI